MTIGDAVAIGAIAFAICIYSCVKVWAEHKERMRELELDDLRSNGSEG